MLNCGQSEPCLPCQHLGGISVVDRVVDSLTAGIGNTDGSLVLMDLLGYDAWPATHALLQSAAGQSSCSWFSWTIKTNILHCGFKNSFLKKLTIEKHKKITVVHTLWFNLAGKRVACGTACHTQHEAQFCSTAISQKAYSMARAGSLRLPGFPNFESVVEEMNNAKEVVTPQYEVTVPLGNGCLAIKESLIEYWSKDEHLFGNELADVLKEHNRKYNPKGIKRGATSSAGESAENAPAAKRVKVEASVKGVDQEAHITEKHLWYYN